MESMDEVRDVVIDLTEEGKAQDFLPVAKTGGEIPANLHLLPLKYLVIFPGMMVPLVVPKDSPSLPMLDHILKSDRKHVVAVSQKNPESQDPGPGDLHSVGTAARIVKHLRLPDG